MISSMAFNFAIWCAGNIGASLELHRQNREYVRLMKQSTTRKNLAEKYRLAGNNNGKRKEVQLVKISSIICE